MQSILKRNGDRRCDTFLSAQITSYYFSWLMKNISIGSGEKNTLNGLKSELVKEIYEVTFTFQFTLRPSFGKI